MRIDFFRGTRIEMRYSNENRKRIFAEKKLKRKSIFDICIDIGKNCNCIDARWENGSNKEILSARTKKGTLLNILIRYPKY